MQCPFGKPDSGPNIPPLSDTLQRSKCFIPSPCPTSRNCYLCCFQSLELQIKMPPLFSLPCSVLYCWGHVRKMLPWKVFKTFLLVWTITGKWSVWSGYLCGREEDKKSIQWAGLLSTRAHQGGKPSGTYLWRKYKRSRGGGAVEMEEKP